MKVAIGAALFLASPAYAEVVEIPFSGSLSSAYGDFQVGEAFSGRITYNFTEFDSDPDAVYYGFTTFSFKVGSFEYSTDITYTGFQPATGYFSTAGQKSDLNRIEFFGVPSTPGFFPTTEQFAGVKGYISFATIQAVDANGDAFYSGGDGVALVAPVPEPATWVAMFLGLALAVSAAQYRRRQSRMTFAHT